jgi:hypothetical protein
VFWKALRDAVNGKDIAGLGFAAQLLLIQEFSGCRNKQRFEITSSEAQARRIGHGHGDDRVDLPVRPIAHHPAACEKRRP